MALSIFQGKKRLYNELILKSLIAGSKTVKQISEYIYLNTKHKAKHNPENVKRSIYSVIDRPKSRLWELSSKGYIEKRDGKWRLTLKGFCVALTCFKSFDEAARVFDFKSLYPEIAEAFKFVIKSPKFAPLRAPYVDDRVKEVSERVSGEPRVGELFLAKIRDCTLELISEGVNLDGLSEDRFMWLLAVKIVMGWFSQYAYEHGEG